MTDKPSHKTGELLSRIALVGAVLAGPTVLHYFFAQENVMPPESLPEIVAQETEDDCAYQPVLWQTQPGATMDLPLGPKWDAAAPKQTDISPPCPDKARPSSSLQNKIYTI